MARLTNRQKELNLLQDLLTYLNFAGAKARELRKFAERKKRQRVPTLEQTELIESAISSKVTFVKELHKRVFAAEEESNRAKVIAKEARRKS